MSKYPEIDAVLAGESDGCIVCGDCLEVMAGVKDGCVDAVVTDPPYGLPGGVAFTTAERALLIIHWECAAVILDWRNPLRGPRKVGELVWEYGWVSGYRAKAKSGVCHTHNTIHLLGKPDSFHFTNGSIIKREPGFSSPRHCSFAAKTGHPYEKPVALMEFLIERIDAGIILDPFCGSGTTCLAAKKLGRRYVGIEIDPGYAEIARERVASTPKPLF